MRTTTLNHTAMSLTQNSGRVHMVFLCRAATSESGTPSYEGEGQGRGIEEGGGGGRGNGGKTISQ